MMQGFFIVINAPVFSSMIVVTLLRTRNSRPQKGVISSSKIRPRLILSSSVSSICAWS